MSEFLGNPDHLEILKRGVEEWNKWRRENRTARPDLKGANLKDANLREADFRDANLREADFRDANLRGADSRDANLMRANLTNANLTNANLTSAYLTRAKLMHANLTNANLANASLTSANLTNANLRNTNFLAADLSQADLTGASLVKADLGFAKLEGAELQGSNLTSADLMSASLRDSYLCNASLTRAEFGHTILASTRGVGLAYGLHLVAHRLPSTIGIDTFENFAQELQELQDPNRRQEVETFLRGAGVPETMMSTFAAMVENPIDFYSAFVSYSHADRAFARRLYTDLQARGIRCWLDEHELRPGDSIPDSIDRGIRLWDKVLLCCSFQSLTSWWVGDEIDKALEKERKLLKDRKEKVLAIIPINLDGSLFDWEDGNASTLRKRLAADFTDWDKDNAKYEAQLDQVVKALRADALARPEPPPSKL
ncbi:MAG: toll/interleukin-1 receptor domain-containing protein [Acidobacteriota bacterium]